LVLVKAAEKLDVEVAELFVEQTEDRHDTT
jgi:hypothetical protein